MMSAQNYDIKGGKINCSDCRIHAKQMEIVSTMSDVKLVELSRKKRE